MGQLGLMAISFPISEFSRIIRYDIDNGFHWYTLIRVRSISLGAGWPRCLGTILFLQRVTLVA